MTHSNRLTLLGIFAILGVWGFVNMLKTLDEALSSYTYEVGTYFPTEHGADKCEKFYNNGHSEEWRDCMGVGKK